MEKIEIIYEDDYLLIVNKPSNLLVHPTKYDKEENLLDLIKLQRGDTYFLIHRLDRDTSGILLIAKSLLSQIKHQELFKNQKIKKTYLAIVQKPLKHKHMQINFALGRDKFGTMRMVNTRLNGKNYKSATTEVRVLNTSPNEKNDMWNDRPQLIQATIQTGRTHQIRAHLFFVDSPILNDPMYGTKQDEYGQYLHAYSLCFISPFNSEKQKFIAPLRDGFIQKLNELNISFVEPIESE